MKETYEPDVQALKQRAIRWRRLFVLLILGGLTLVLLCAAVNFTFFAAGMALGNMWPFPTAANPAAPRMIAAYQVNQAPEPPPAVADDQLYQQTFSSRSLPGWNLYADGWDVQNGVLYGTNTRADVRPEAVYGRGAAWTDYTLEADVTAQGGADGSSVGLLFRYQEGERGAHCRLRTTASGRRQLELVTPEGQLLPASFHFVNGETYRLRATAVGRTLTCQILGHPDASLSATTDQRQGTVGLQNQGISGAFDNLMVHLGRQ